MLHRYAETSEMAEKFKRKVRSEGGRAEVYPPSPARKVYGNLYEIEWSPKTDGGWTPVRRHRRKSRPVRPHARRVRRHPIRAEARRLRRGAINLAEHVFSAKEWKKWTEEHPR